MVFALSDNDRTRGVIQIRGQEEILHPECGEAPEQVAQRSCGCPIPGVQGQVGWGPGQPDLVGGIPSHGL